VGASIEGELHLIMDASVSYPIQCFFTLCLISISLRIAGGHFPGMVTSGDNVTNKHFTEMRRLDHDESPFLLAMPPRATNLAW
jgi:hypothetical protein